MVKDLVDFKTTLYFGVPSLVSVYFTRYFLLPLIPDSIINFDGLEISKEVMIILLFSILMILSSFSMIRKRIEVSPTRHSNSFFLPKILFQGLIVGFITGLVGAGGGFLIVPALVFFCELPMRKAVATSLAIIAINTSLGFIGDIVHGIDLNWVLLFGFSSSSLIGTFIGIVAYNSLNENQLKIIFGWFVLIMGVFIFVKELFL